MAPLTPQSENRDRRFVDSRCRKERKERVVCDAQLGALGAVVPYARGLDCVAAWNTSRGGHASGACCCSSSSSSNRGGACCNTQLALGWRSTGVAQHLSLTGGVGDEPENVEQAEQDHERRKGIWGRSRGHDAAASSFCAAAVAARGGGTCTCSLLPALTCGGVPAPFEQHQLRHGRLATGFAQLALVRARSALSQSTALRRGSRCVAQRIFPTICAAPPQSCSRGAPRGAIVLFRGSGTFVRRQLLGSGAIKNSACSGNRAAAPCGRPATCGPLPSWHAQGRGIPHAASS